MKFYYKTIFRPFDLSHSELIKNIISELDKPGYVIEDQTQKIVIFRDNKWRLASRTENFTRVDGGSFEINPANTITFSYYISPQLEVIGILIVAILGLTQDSYLFLFIVFILVMFFVRSVFVKIAANRMINNILSN